MLHKYMFASVVTKCARFMLVVISIILGYMIFVWPYVRYVHAVSCAIFSDSFLMIEDMSFMMRYLQINSSWYQSQEFVVPFVPVCKIYNNHFRSRSNRKSRFRVLHAQIYSIVVLWLFCIWEYNVENWD